jgi:excisionase family DNA binding protein
VTPITRYTNVDDLPALCRVHEVAAWLGVSRGQAYAMVKSGALASVRLGRLVRVPREALAALVAERRTA